MKHTVVDLVTGGNRIDAVISHNKSGFTKVNAQYVIDATGDADIAVFSGHSPGGLMNGKLIRDSQ